MSGLLGLVASKEEAKGHSNRSQHAVEHRLRAHLKDWKPGGCHPGCRHNILLKFSEFKSDYQTICG
ncbi:hypothetical protein DPMN_192537 [Dreissena polymorpha]|uniref:Uncharacterized protein n=1 Tax=Dreissena polymorpha TaxID=45954 RepID=A0A9D4B8G5_DREPO|nr:hypothetical protein DPMN_192537 [Dreissena polymorpha]